MWVQSASGSAIETVAGSVHAGLLKNSILRSDERAVRQAWDESAVIGDMLRATLDRFGDADYRIFVGHYRNDEATAVEIMRVDDARIQPVEIDADGPTSKADCLNHLYDALIAHEWGLDRPATERRQEQLHQHQQPETMARRCR